MLIHFRKKKKKQLVQFSMIFNGFPLEFPLDLVGFGPKSPKIPQNPGKFSKNQPISTVRGS